MVPLTTMQGTGFQETTVETTLVRNALVENSGAFTTAERTQWLVKGKK